jgi:hypothetical protein
MKKILVSKWIPEVIEKLEENNVVNKKGEPYTKGYISHVFNGKNEHPIIEDAILDVYQERKEKLSKMREERKNRLKIEEQIEQ